MCVLWHREDLISEISKYIVGKSNPKDILSMVMMLSEKFPYLTIFDRENVYRNWRFTIEKQGIDNFVNSTNFLTLPQDMVCELLRSNEILMNEVDLYQRILTWGAWNQSDGNMNEILEKPMSLIRFGLFEIDDLLGEVKDKEFVSMEIYIAALEMQILKNDPRINRVEFPNKHLMQPRKVVKPSRIVEALRKIPFWQKIILGSSVFYTGYMGLKRFTGWMGW